MSLAFYALCVAFFALVTVVLGLALREIEEDRRASSRKVADGGG